MSYVMKVSRYKDLRLLGVSRVDREKARCIWEGVSFKFGCACKFVLLQWTVESGCLVHCMSGCWDGR